MKCSKISWQIAALTVDFRKHSGPTPADDMAAQIITACGNFTLDFKQHGFCASPLFLQTLGPLNKLYLTVFSSLLSSLLLVHISLPNFLPVNFAFNMLWYSTPWTATPFSNDPLWLTLFVEGVNNHRLDHCQVSSVPHYCGFKEQEIPTINTVWMVIY